jgi:sodium-independent sulfate anion transporter 11
VPAAVESAIAGINGKLAHESSGSSQEHLGTTELQTKHD